MSVETISNLPHDSTPINYLVQVNISVEIFGAIIVGSVLCSCLLAFISGVVLGMSSGIKYSSKIMNSVKQRATDLQNAPVGITPGPVYEEVAFDNNETINLEQNIAYS